jgi:MFS family permease
MKAYPALAGMRGFLLIGFGQLVSQLGSRMAQFALAIWAWQLTGQATTLALVTFFTLGPTVLLSPVAGALVDRWNRKLMLILSDLAAGLSTLVLLLLYSVGELQVWHLYVAGAFAGAFQSFQFPAFPAAMTLMLRKEQYARANGILSLVEAAANIAGPPLGALALGAIGIAGVMAIDALTFIVAIGTLLAVSIPQPTAPAAARDIRAEIAYGFRYIWERPSLRGMVMVPFFGNIVITLGLAVIAPMILARTSGNQVILGTVQAAFGLGALAGSLLISVWGGPRGKKIYMAFGGWALLGLVGPLPIGLGRDATAWIAGAFCLYFCVPIIMASANAIYQAKVAPEVQGRVFGVRRMLATVTEPLATLAAGPLADRVFTPALLDGGSLVAAFGWLVGTGPGAGMALMLVLAGLLTPLAPLVGMSFRALREAEAILPDHVVSSVT